MANKYKFHESFKVGLDNIESRVPKETWESLVGLLEYKQKDFVEILSEEGVKQTISVAQSIVDNCTDDEVKKYKDYKIIQYIRDALYEYLEEKRMDMQVSGIKEVCALSMALQDSSIKCEAWFYNFIEAFFNNPLLKCEYGENEMCWERCDTSGEKTITETENRNIINLRIHCPLLIAQYHEMNHPNFLNDIPETSTVEAFQCKWVNKDWYKVFFEYPKAFHVYRSTIQEECTESISKRNSNVTKSSENDEDEVERNRESYLQCFGIFWNSVKNYSSTQIWAARYVLNKINSEELEGCLKSADGEMDLSNLSKLKNEIETAESNLLLLLVEEWKKEAGNISKGFRQEKRELLFQGKKNMKKSVLGKVKVKHRNWNDTHIIEIYLDFMCSYIFQKEDFWRIVYDDGALRQEYYNKVLDDMLNPFSRNKQDGLWDVGKHSNIINKIMGDNTLVNMEWFCPENANKIFEVNYARYSFQRCFTAVLNMLVGEEQLALEFFSSPPHESLGLKPQIHYIFMSWITEYRKSFCDSLLKEILWIVICNTTIPKEKRKKVRYSDFEGFYIAGEKGTIKERLWEVSNENMESFEKSEHELNKHTSVGFQLLDSSWPRNHEFSTRINHILEMEKSMNYFESYSIENQYGIYTSWKVYSMVREYKSSAGLSKAIEDLAESIGSIANLELRLFVSEQIEKIIQSNKTRDENIVSVLEKTESIIKEEAEKFNDLYIRMQQILIWIFKDEKRWKDVFWLRNEEVTCFSRIRLEVKVLMKSINQSKNKSDKEEMFQNLYYAKSKTNATDRLDPYHLYNNICNKISSH